MPEIIPEAPGTPEYPVEKPTDHMPLRTYWEMDTDQFDQLSEVVLGHPYNFVARQEASNDVCYTYRVSENDVALAQPLDKWAGPYHILTALCVAGVLPVGNYLVRVSW